MNEHVPHKRKMSHKRKSIVESNKRLEVVESCDRLRSEKTWHYKNAFTSLIQPHLPFPLKAFTLAVFYEEIPIYCCSVAQMQLTRICKYHGFIYLRLEKCVCYIFNWMRQRNSGLPS